ncbi:MAG TPA: phenylalanine--tRNA ligase subunit beta [Candidatus Binatia bacterium]|jgi:phenylalanyl-tRNA synthetase beta chain|nr:phenylalanine--tRNA ligase subunit beta [Candidatus Binatia bacterium]
MNILASYNWIKEYVGLKENADAFARRISLSGPAVERLHPQAPLYDKMVIGQIKDVKAHPNPKVTKLRIVATDVGGEKPLEIVCGGSNLEPGMKVVVALVGAKVKWHGQGDLVELAPAVIQGVESQGMICGANEIGLADAFPHAEREIMDVSWLKAKPGTPLAKALDLDDTVFDIEVTTNRPDAYSMVGLAREAAAVFGAKFLWREPVLPSLPKGTTAVELSVQVKAPKLCTRYQAAVMTDVTVGPSPWWLKRRLIQAGLRPINTVVDITNYVMLEYGQPMHAFDYENLAGHAIVVRNAREGEKMMTLDGVERALSPSHLVIADAEKAVAVAGVMGGELSGVSEKTKTIVFESATFDPVSVRRTARSLNLHSDSSLRYEKGLPEDLTSAALARAVELCQEIALGKVASKVFDERSAPRKKVKFSFRPEKAEELIGVAIPKKDMLAILKSLGFGVAGSGKKYEVTVPYWRERDIEGERDFAEEIARVYGYANLPSVMPAGELPPGSGDAILDEEEHAKRFFKGAGCTELINYSLVPAWHFEKTGMDLSGALRVANPLSADFEYLRMSLLPGFLQTIQENQGLFPEGRVFEVSNVYLKKDKGLPDEVLALAGAVWGPYDDDRLFREAKGLLEAYAAEVGVRLSYERMSGGPQHPGRGVKVFSEGEFVGWVSETHPDVCRKFGIDGRVAAFEAPLAKFLAHRSTHAKYAAIPQFPPVKRDLAFVLGERTEYGDVEASLRQGSALLKEVELFDVYRGKNLGDGKKSLAVHLTFSTPERTLTTEEIDAEIACLTQGVADKFGATVRS